MCRFSQQGSFGFEGFGHFLQTRPGPNSGLDGGSGQQGSSVFVGSLHGVQTGPGPNPGVMCKSSQQIAAAKATQTLMIAKIAKNFIL